MLFSYYNIFTYLFHLIKGDTEFILKARELNSLYRIFKSGRYKYIGKDKTITHLFLNRFFEFYKNVVNCYEFLSNTLFNNDEHKKKFYINTLIESNLSDDDLIFIKEKLDKDFLIKKVIESENPNKYLSVIENELKEFKKKLTNKYLRNVDEVYNFFYNLYHLTTFNYDAFFSKFDPTFNSKNMKQPNYSRVTGNEILNDLKDLYYIIATMPKKLNVMDQVKLLSMRFKSGNLDEYAKKIQQSIDEIYKYINGDFNSEIILNMIKFIEENPKLRIKVNYENLTIVDNYSKNLVDQFYSNKEYIIKEFSVKSIQNQIREIFKNIEIQNIDGFSDDLELLVAKKLGLTIEGVQGLRILKTFIFNLYETEYKDKINTLIVEGFFIDKDFQKDLSDSYFKLNELKDYWNRVEKELKEGQNGSFEVVNNLLNSSNPVNIKKGQTQLELLNERIQVVNRKIVDSLFLFGKQLFIVLNEYKSPKLEKISNIKEIKGALNKEFIASLVEIYNVISKIVKIMKNFIRSDSK